jgi:hypothetical protein
MGMHQVRHPLFFIVARRKAIVLPTIGTLRYAHSMGKKVIMWYISGINKPRATS